MPENIFVGLMSGTSLDGIDAVAVSFDEPNQRVEQLACRHDEFPANIKKSLVDLINDPDSLDPTPRTKLDMALADLYGASTIQLLREAGIATTQVTAIGCHGQTINHQPDADPPFSIQLGDGQRLADLTGIITVNDFRRADIELGGQGAPLAPGFHAWAFTQPDRISGVVNLGGIANITVIDSDNELIGYDTGPANTLLDMWCLEQFERPFDAQGEWARSGTINTALLDHMLADNYFPRVPPKSTGREYFNRAWLEHHLRLISRDLHAADVQATLAELTAVSVTAAAQNHACEALWLCGGGAHNLYLVERIAAHLPAVSVESTAALGIEPDWVEAIAFAWLALARINGVPAGRPSVTGAREAALLGVISKPTKS